MKKEDKLIVSIKVEASVRDINPNGTFNVYIRKIGNTHLNSYVVVKNLIPSQIETI